MIRTTKTDQDDKSAEAQAVRILYDLVTSAIGCLQENYEEFDAESLSVDYLKSELEKAGCHLPQDFERRMAHATNYLKFALSTRDRIT